MTPTKEDFEMVDEYADIDYFFEPEEKQTKSNKAKHIIMASFIGLAILLIFSLIIGFIEMKSYNTNRVITQSYINESKTYDICDDYITYIVNEVYKPATTNQTFSQSKWQETQKNLVLKATEVNKKIDNVNKYISDDNNTVKGQYYLSFLELWELTAYRKINEINGDGKTTGNVLNAEIDFAGEDITTPSTLFKIFKENAERNSKDFVALLNAYSEISVAYNKTLR